MADRMAGGLDVQYVEEQGSTVTDRPATPTGRVSNVSFGTSLEVQAARELRNLSFGCQVDQPLAEPWQFWLAEADAAGATWGHQCVGTVTTARGFWRHYNQLRPDDRADGTALLVTRQRMDPASAAAGATRFVITAQSRPALSRLWLDVSLALVGAQLDRGDAVRACVCCPSACTAAVWASGAADPHVLSSLQEQLRMLAPRGSTVAVHTGAGAVCGGEAGGDHAAVAAAIAADLSAGQRGRRGSCPGADEVSAVADEPPRYFGRAFTAAGRLTGWAQEEESEAATEAADPSAVAYARAFTALSGLNGAALGRTSSARRSSSSGPLEVSSDRAHGYVPAAPLRVASGLRVSWATDDSCSTGVSHEVRSFPPDAAMEMYQQHMLQQPQPPPHHHAHQQHMMQPPPALPVDSPYAAPLLFAAQPLPPHMPPPQQQQQQPVSPQRMRAGRAAAAQTPEGWDVATMLQYLEVEAGLAPVPTDDSKYSKSRSPRNRRKIRERKIREAAALARREMLLWSRQFGLPEDAWIDPVQNLYVPRPPAFEEEDWFRIIQACKGDGLTCDQVRTVEDGGLDRLGADTPEKVQALRWTQCYAGPQPSPLYAVSERMRTRPLQLPPPRAAAADEAADM